ncbi:ankyrin repeat domain-containing protein [Sinomicrobium weinanense]|uniref:Ankyrin repeat domain-containing protein n=1 Tax=Sinomicrobium weinanense TaxID=2842200 RepID=A0A926JS46_9FLAO|nr:ankyrin repeat domain-containing protein [Sinomicrobium weinanense]MBC9796263.1 ankyrin repeat domain-containing protein [Sinomicrobium weinanense]MBU3122282.1 ankyrin repeat domain-containing protein [Sinomicrobium weinanense]
MRPRSRQKKVFNILICLFASVSGACAQPDDPAEKELWRAAKKNDVAAIQKLLKKGVDLEAKDAKKRTALMLATYENNVEAAGVLIKAGADVNARDHILTSPFLYAGANGYLEILKLCLNSGKVDYKVVNRYGGTALIPACERGHVSTVKELLKLDDFPIDHVNKLGWTALMEAIVLSNGGPRHVEIVQLLVDAGCNVNIPDNDGVTPLMHAEQKGFKEIAAILKKAGAK